MVAGFIILGLRLIAIQFVVLKLKKNVKKRL